MFYKSSPIYVLQIHFLQIQTSLYFTNSIHVLQIESSPCFTICPIISILSRNILKIKENHILETRTTPRRLNALSG